MGHTMASWKILEDLLIELKKKGVAIPANVINDLRSAKSMINLGCTEDAHGGDVILKAEEYSANVEAFLVEEAQKVLGAEQTNQWLKRLEEANFGVCEQPKKEDNFITGVPRDQKWVRVEPTSNVPAERIEQIAKEQNLQVKLQSDGRLVVFGQSDDIKAFVKAMAQATAK